MNEFWQTLAEKDTIIPVVAIGLGCMVAMVSIVASAWRSAVKTREIEQTKREMAAYVAEGSIDPDEAVAMLNAGKKPGTDGTSACC